MALIKCYECGTDISEKAKACPECGAPTRPGPRPVQEAPTDVSARRPEGGVVRPSAPAPAAEPAHEEASRGREATLFSTPGGLAASPKAHTAAPPAKEAPPPGPSLNPSRRTSPALLSLIAVVLLVALVGGGYVLLRDRGVSQLGTMPFAPVNPPVGVGTPPAAVGGMVSIAGGLLRGLVVEPFFIDATEVTVRAYLACADAGSCGRPGRIPGCNNDLQRADHPVTCVSRDQAATFCQWAGKRLPSGREWELAAGGPEGRPYPWGSAAPDCSRADFTPTGVANDSCGGAGTSPAGSHPAGATRDGVQDLAGNVWEWTGDPPRGGAHSVETRGGTWGSPAAELPSAGIRAVDADSQRPGIGFRCARSGSVSLAPNEPPAGAQPRMPSPLSSTGAAARLQQVVLRLPGMPRAECLQLLDEGRAGDWFEFQVYTAPRCAPNAQDTSHGFFRVNAVDRRVLQLGLGGDEPVEVPDAPFDVSDIETWHHPVKRVLSSEGVALHRVVLTQRGAFPTFTVTLPAGISQDRDKLRALYDRLCRANYGFAYELDDLSRGTRSTVQCGEAGAIAGAGLGW